MSVIRCFAASVAAAILVIPARAEPPAPRPPGAYTRYTPFLSAVQDQMGGERVMAVDNGTTLREPRDVTPATDDKLLHRLQVICEQYGGEENALVPFAVRGAWVLAPAMRDEVRTDFSGLALVEAMGASALLTRAVASVPLGQAEQLGSDEGIPFGALPPEGRESLARLFRSPRTVMTLRDTGPYHVEMDKENPPRTVRVTDLEGVRLRAQLLSTGVRLSGEATGSVGMYDGLWDPDGKRVLFSSRDKRWSSDVEFPAITRTPNSPKPSGLDGKLLGKSLGFQGVVSVADLLRRLSEATGLALSASPQYREWMVFVGSGDVTAGEVVDGLPQALTASWRKLGDSYLLTWDRRGLGTLEAEIRESTDPMLQEMAMGVHAMREGRWLNVARALPFAPRDLTPWTDAQRKKLLGPPDPAPSNPTDGSQPGRFIVSFDGLTPAQQEAARERTGEAARAKSGSPAPLPDARSAYLSPSALVLVSVYLPETGWVEPPPAYGREINPGRFIDRQKAAETERAGARVRAEKAARPVASPPPTPATPLVPATTRGVMVPALSPDALVRVATAMKSKGFDVLFYPAFSGGYATFPTRAFPPLPSRRGNTGWVEAARISAEQGLTLVATVDTLAWHGSGDRKHWLDASPGWLDMDIQGRNLTEIAAARNSYDRSPPLEARGDLARPTPEARLRLETLLDDLARQPGVNGVLFDAWGPATALYGGSSSTHVRLGYAMPDRLAALKDFGFDPVDVLRATNLDVREAGAVAPLPAGAVKWTADDMSKSTLAPGYRTAYDSLLAALLGRAKSNGKGWKTYATIWTTDWDHPAPARPPADTLLRPHAGDSGLGADALIRLPPRAVLARMREVDPGQAAAYDMSTAEFVGGWFHSRDTFSLAVYDFRDAPDAVLNALETAVLPEPPAY